MNRIYLDYDVVDMRLRVEHLAANFEPYEMVILGEDNETACRKENMEEVPVRGILLTKLNSGWHNYHTQMIMDNHEIVHWVVAVLWDGKKKIRDTMQRHIISVFEEADSYCEVIFDDTQNWQLIEKVMQKPIKTGKSCLVISRNIPLAQKAARIMQNYLGEWTVHPCEDPEKPDYDYEDAVFLVGYSVNEMLVPYSVKEMLGSYSVNGVGRRLIWMHNPMFMHGEERHKVIKDVASALKESGWSIADDKIFLSSLKHEVAMFRLIQDEITPTALVQDDDYIMWDSYGLPIPQGCQTDKKVKEFLEENCVFQTIAEMISAKKKK